MIIGFEGGLGTGKTIGMVRYLYRDHVNLKREIRANFWLNFPYKPLNITELLSNKQPLENVSVGIDEITVFADCRNSMDKLNKVISYFILQTRKRNVCLYFTTQDFGMVDKRIIRHTHIKIHCKDIAGVDHLKHYEVFDQRKSLFTPPQDFTLDIRPYYDLYDTKELIMPLLVDVTKNEKKEEKV